MAEQHEAEERGTEQQEPAKHTISKVRYELQRRVLVVRRADQLTPRMLRITLGGDALEGFTSPAADDHVKLFAPTPEGPQGRDYTVRYYDAEARELTLDFALHDAGPATDWARQASPGHTIEIAGPRGSTLIPTDFDWWLLVGDETALPAIGRRIEELPPGTPVTSLVAIAGLEDEQQFDTQATHRALWIHRPLDRADEPSPFLSVLDEQVPAHGDGFIWIAGETGVARALRRHVLEVLRHPQPWTKVAGYWMRGKADARQKFE